MEINPGDILYRKYSDQNDLYCVISVYANEFNSQLRTVRLFPYYQGRGQNFLTEVEPSIENWYIVVDLNNYDVKTKFLVKIKTYLDKNLGEIIAHKQILDNLTYIEILAALKQYETKETEETEETDK